MVMGGTGIYWVKGKRKYNFADKGMGHTEARRTRRGVSKKLEVEIVRASLLRGHKRKVPWHGEVFLLGQVTR